MRRHKPPNTAIRGLGQAESTSPPVGLTIKAIYNLTSYTVNTIRNKNKLDSLLRRRTRLSVCASHPNPDPRAGTVRLNWTSTAHRLRTLPSASGANLIIGRRPRWWFYVNRCEKVIISSLVERYANDVMETPLKNRAVYSARCEEHSSQLLGRPVVSEQVHRADISGRLIWNKRGLVCYIQGLNGSGDLNYSSRLSRAS